MAPRAQQPQTDLTQHQSSHNFEEAKLHLELFRQAMDHAGNGIIITRAEGKDNIIIYANQAFCDLTGYKLTDVIGRDCRFLQRSTTDKSIIDLLRQAIANRQATSVILQNYRQDGTPFWNELSLSPVPADHTSLYYIGVQKDITSIMESKRRLEDEVERRTSTLRALNAELDEFAGVTTHDLQEPLKAIGGYLELLNERYRQVLDLPGQEFLDYAREASERIRKMLDDLLMYARLERTAKDFKPVSLQAVLAEACQNLQLQIDQSRAHVEAHDLPVVSGEPRQLVQLFQNLIRNAITYRSVAPPVIKITATDAGERWEIKFSDNGRGFNPRYSERIFRVFTRLEHPSAHDPSDGIGLAIAMKIARAHGGNISAQSRRGHGSVFTVTLPKLKES